MSGTLAQSGPSRTGLLVGDDPPPFEVVNGAGRACAVLACDHAYWRVPKALGHLGVDPVTLRRHIGWDIGAGEVTRRLSALLDAPAVLAGFSRLVIDCNRPLDSPASIPHLSDGVEVPGNCDVDDAEAGARAEACFWPYHRSLDDMLERVARRRGRLPVLVAVHTFTPAMAGFERPWHVGILWDHDAATARPLIDALAADPAVCVGDNQPYSGREPVPYTIPAHAVARGLPHVTVEVRQDLVETTEGAAAWADILGTALRSVLAETGRISSNGD